MDAKQFDHVAKAVGQGTARRQLLAGFLGAVLTGSLGPVTGSAKSKRQHHKRRLKAQRGNSQNAKRCQKGGWATLARAGDATVPFTSENACVSYGAQGGQLVPVVVNPCQGQADGTLCGPAGSGLRCCNGVCPSPTCRTAGTPCGAEETEATCSPQCCSGRLRCFPCECDANPPDPDFLCASDADCRQNSGAAECRCSRCCLLTGVDSRLVPVGCLACCSGTCQAGTTLCA